MQQFYFYKTVAMTNLLKLIKVSSFVYTGAWQ